MRQNGVETDHPLKRIQEEINEVAKRERELRQRDNRENNNHNDNSNYHDDNSDDSGFSMCSSPVHNNITNGEMKQPQKQDVKPQIKNTTENSYSVPQSKILTRARSTPQLFQKSPINNRFNGLNNARGMMQKFIASRGKITNSSIKNNSINYLQTSESPRSTIFIPPNAITTPAVIERDSNGRPIRPGYISVEEKIQKELKDLKSREVELKRIRRVRNQSDSDSLDNNYDTFDSGEASAEEDNDNNFSTTALAGKLRTAKSIGELCDALNNSSQQTRDTPSPQFDRRRLRPALSLAQLCDLDPTEAPSSHKLIEKFENLISKK